PGERLVFLTGLVFLPAVILCLSFALRWWTRPGRFLAPLENCWIVDLACASLFFVFCVFCLVEHQFFHIRHTLFFRHPLAALPLFLGALAAFRFAWNGRWSRWTAHALALALIMVVGLACVFDEGGTYSQNWHFAAAFNSVVQVHFGKALLIDGRGQYGLYAHFLQPLFALGGLSVLKFTLVMALLLAASYVALWVVLRQAVRNQLVALCGFFALVFTGWLSLRFPKDGRFQWVDPYFQYHPIRFLFPTLLVLLGWKYFRQPSRRLYGGTTVLLSVGVLWNFDS